LPLRPGNVNLVQPSMSRGSPMSLYKSVRAQRHEQEEFEEERVGGHATHLLRSSWSTMMALNVSASSAPSLWL
jgi:hypothetical protein